jgi:hypothetical protein
LFSHPFNKSSVGIYSEDAAVLPIGDMKDAARIQRKRRRECRVKLSNRGSLGCP